MTNNINKTSDQSEETSIKQIVDSEPLMIIPQHVLDYIGQQNEITKGVDLVLSLRSEEDFLSADTQLEATEKTAAILRGFLYAHYRNYCGNRCFLEFLEKRGISRSTAYDYMDQATIYAELPNAEMCATVAQLGHSKTRMLKSIPKIERENFLTGNDLNGTTINEALLMTKDEFKGFVHEYKRSTSAELIKANQEKEAFKVRLETAENELMHQRQIADDKYAYVDLPDWVIAIREEAAVHGEMSLNHLAGLEKALSALKGYDEVSHESDKQFAEYRAAASVTFYQIANLVVQANNALVHAKSFLGDKEVGEFDMSLPMTEEEAKQIVDITRMLTEKMTIEESHRVSQRIAKQGRVGAPKKNPKAYEDEL